MHDIISQLVTFSSTELLPPPILGGEVREILSSPEVRFYLFYSLFPRVYRTFFRGLSTSNRAISHYSDLSVIPNLSRRNVTYSKARLGNLSNFILQRYKIHDVMQLESFLR